MIKAVFSLITAGFALWITWTIMVPAPKPTASTSSVPPRTAQPSVDRNSLPVYTPEQSARPLLPAGFNYTYDGALAITKCTWVREDGSQYIRGKIFNGNRQAYRYVEVSFKLRNKAGEQVGEAMTNTTDLAAGDTWSFKAVVTEDDVHTADGAVVTAY